jgi:hypothetical protein
MSKNKKLSPQSCGGKATAKILRTKAIKLYYQNPTHCKWCKCIIKIGKGRASQVRRKTFCNRNCAASYNNTFHPKRTSTIDICVGCKKEIALQRNKKGKILHRKYCDTCLQLSRAKHCASITESKQKVDEKCLLINQTKGSLYKRRKNWQSANSAIRRHARKVFEQNTKDKSCYICGYNKYIQVAHIKPVSKFQNSDSIVDDINNINNLIALCPNHHWEFDHGLVHVDCILPEQS